MTEETVVAAPSAAEEVPAVQEMDRSRGPLVDLNPEQRSEYKRTGQLPKAPEPKKEAPAPSPEPKGEETKSESEPEADAGTKQQENTEKGKKKPTAEERIAQLEATIEKIRKGAGIERKAEPAASPEQPKQQDKPPQNYQEWRKQFKASQWIEEYAKANPEAAYEDATAAMSDFLDEVRGQFRQAEERQRSLVSDLNTKVNDARQRYGAKFDEVLTPTLNAIVESQQVLPVVKHLINESEVLPDLLYTLGSNQEELNKFLQMSPGKQARYIALTESLINEELEAKAAPKETPKADPPAPPKTNAPKPPTEVGGRAASPGDEVDSAVRAGDYRRASAEWTRRAIASMK